MLVELKVSGLAVDPKLNMPIVLLQDAEKKKTLPIWIGVFEASAIATQMEHIQLARPMTHDLIRSLMERLGGRLISIEIIDMKDNTFFASLVLSDASGNTDRLDCRPSDAIALALRCGAPIFVDDRVLALAAEGVLNAPSEELLKNLSEEAFGKYKM